MHIKVCCIQSVEEARLCYDQGVNMIGFVSDMPSGFRILEDIQIKTIIDHIDFEIDKVLLTSKIEAQDLINQIKFTGADTVQIVDSVNPIIHIKIKEALPYAKTIQVIHVENEGAIAEANSYQKVADYILLDSGIPKSNRKHKVLGGTGKTHNWKLSEQIVTNLELPVILAGGLNPDNISNAIGRVKPFGVDVCTGLRDPKFLVEKKLRDFIYITKKSSFITNF